MLRLFALALCLAGCADNRALRILAAGLGGAAASSSSAPATETGLYEREFRSGMNKVCVYRTTTGDRYLTIDQAQLCPLTL